MSRDRPLGISYVLPVRAEVVDPDLVQYLAGLADQVEDLIVVDGSDPHVFDGHRQALPPGVRHIRPERETLMGKVGGVLTGLRWARCEVVVLADDDVRWDRNLLERAIDGLGDADAARPQNVFSPRPWHARWDTGRILVNRGLDGDWPGTLVVRAAALPHGYAGDVMFENLELVRTIEAAGGEVRVLLDVVVPRRPPATDRFLEQRVRQAYDELARPGHLAVELALLPAVARCRLKGLVAIALAATTVAEIGRRRAGGRAHWGPTASFWAIPWVLERSITAWLALAARARGGISYRGRRLPTAAHSRAALRARLTEGNATSVS